jgi:cell wall-associated NlpC family hydrolase
MMLLYGCLPASRMARPAAGSADAHRAVDHVLSTVPLTPERRKVLDEAEGWIGTPYQFGGYTRSGVDCSGFVCNVFGSVSRKMPRNSAEQASVGESVTLSQAQPGDLVFFNTSGAGVSHVGILLDSGSFIHASTSNGVTVSRLSEPYYQSHFMFARRVLL